MTHWELQEVCQETFSSLYTLILQLAHTNGKFTDVYKNKVVKTELHLELKIKSAGGEISKFEVQTMILITSYL